MSVAPNLVAALDVEDVEGQRFHCHERVPQPADLRPRRRRPRRRGRGRGRRRRRPRRGQAADLAGRQVDPRDADGREVGVAARVDDRVLTARVRRQGREADVQVGRVRPRRLEALLDLRVLVRLTVRRDEALEPLRDAPGELALLLLRLVCGLQIRVRLGRALPAAVEVVARDLFGRCPAAGGGLDVAQQGVALLPLALQPAQVTDLVVARALGVLAFLLL
mmetsp:Transcript_43232/g.135143  ORF Transcript_43232/g.135143 Transcript_43232/m.135143 type:complete len:221 (+) Transcript_43232:1224-1886(+)